MTERDAFELRFHAAVRGYVGRLSSEIDPAELASRIAAAEPRRHGFAPALAWRSVAIPRRAWVLLLFAGLLAAMIGGMLVVGSPPERKVPAVLPPVGQMFTCPPGSTPDKPGPVDQARPPLSSGVTAFDRRAGRIVLVGPNPDEVPGVDTWTFDVCTNTWTRMHPDREPPSSEWARLVYDVDSDVTIGVFSGTVFAYDLAANTWTEKRRIAPPGAWLAAYDPVSGRVLAGSNTDPLQLWTYDVETDAWTLIHQANGPGGVFAYDASVDRVVAYTGATQGHETWLLDIRTGTWSRSGAVTPHVLDWLAPPAIAFDQAAKRTVVGGNEQLAAYDATANRWETFGFPAVYHGVSIVYDPVNERLVVLPDSWESWSAGRGAFAGVVALDLVSREWTVLLAP